MKMKINEIPNKIKEIEEKLKELKPNTEEYDSLLGELDYYNDLKSRFELSDITKDKY